MLVINHNTNVQLLNTVKLIQPIIEYSINIRVLSQYTRVLNFEIANLQVQQKLFVRFCFNHNSATNRYFEKRKTPKELP